MYGIAIIYVLGPNWPENISILFHIPVLFPIIFIVASLHGFMLQKIRYVHTGGICTAI